MDEIGTDLCWEELSGARDDGGVGARPTAGLGLGSALRATCRAFARWGPGPAVGEA